MTLKYVEYGPVSGKISNIVILLHGYGSNADDLISIGQEIGDLLPETLFISPNAPFQCEISAFGFQWFSLQDWSLNTMLKGAEAAAKTLNEFIDEILKKHNIPENKLVLSGFSQGCMMSLYVGLNRKISGILGFSGRLVAGPDFIPKEKPPVCLLHGNMDTVVPFSSLAEAKTVLSKAGIKIETHELQGLGHGINLQAIDIGVNFLKKVLS